MTTLKPCPFCGSERIEYVQIPTTSWYGLSCMKCCSHGPTMTNKTTSIDKWNTRPLEDKLQAELEQMPKLIIQNGRLAEEKFKLQTENQRLWKFANEAVKWIPKPSALFMEYRELQKGQDNE